jgi:hypothetical protein
MAEAALENPNDKYPKPPFKRQTQPWPGLASKMEPRPDHGEKSYRGSGRLAGRKALITGGDSGMGQARMDFSAWYEVFLDGRWFTFDARHNHPRIGRIVISGDLTICYVFL